MRHISWGLYWVWLRSCVYKFGWIVANKYEGKSCSLIGFSRTSYILFPILSSFRIFLDLMFHENHLTKGFWLNIAQSLFDLIHLVGFSHLSWCMHSTEPSGEQIFSGSELSRACYMESRSSQVGEATHRSSYVQY